MKNLKTIANKSVSAVVLLLLSAIIFSSCISGGAPGRAENEDGTTAETVKKSEVDPVEKVSAWLVTREQWIPTCDLVASGGK